MTGSRQGEILARLQRAREFQMNDLKRSIFLARTNFLTALGLAAYTEFWGHFITGTDKAPASFDAFFPLLGANYRRTIQAEPKVYDLFRNGLAHEYLPKRRQFTIYGVDGELSDDQIRRGIPEGLVVSATRLEVFTPRYYLDLREAVDRLISEVPQMLSTQNSNVEKRYKQVNFTNFG
jgi:hypothetical protein